MNLSRFAIKNLLPLAFFSTHQHWHASAENILEKSQGFFIELDGCVATILSSPSATSVNCTFIAPPDIEVRAEILNISCDDFNFPASGGYVEDVKLEGNSTNSTTGNLTVTGSHMDYSITLEEKNNGTEFNRSYCARADLFEVISATDTEKTSVFAKKVNVTVAYTYSTESSFEIANIGIADYVAPTASASSTSSVALRSYQCDENRIESNDVVDVGSSFHMCIEILDDGFATMDKIEQLTFSAENGETAVEPIKNGLADFITEANCTLNEGKMCHVRTLMATYIFDTFGGQPMRAFGTVSVQYNRREKERRELEEIHINNGANLLDPREPENSRSMQAISSERASFAVVFMLGPSTTAQKVQDNLNNAATSISFLFGSASAYHLLVYPLLAIGALVVYRLKM